MTDEKETDAEQLFERLSRVALEAGFELNEVQMRSFRLSRGALPPVVDVRVRSRQHMQRFPSASVFDAMFGE